MTELPFQLITPERNAVRFKQHAQILFQSGSFIV